VDAQIRSATGSTRLEELFYGARVVDDLRGRVVAITGANIGIGQAVARELAARGARLRLLCRSLDRAAPVVEDLRARTDNADIVAIACDLGRLASVRSAAGALLGRDEPLHVLVNNAGVAGQRGQTADGFELHFGVNHLGHFLLTNLLLARLHASVPARIVHVASENHRGARGIDWEAVRRPTASVSGLPEYGVSKLANVLFSAELARRLADTGIETCAVNPGRVASNIWRRLPWPIRPLFKLTMLSPAEGAHSTVAAATGPIASGAYYDRRGALQPASDLARDPLLARELWERSAAWTAG
jgi:NAD(P)-dependent dehydrogenase (short-subunit alcohol dehydrogenase family)